MPPDAPAVRRRQDEPDGRRAPPLCAASALELGYRVEAYWFDVAPREAIARNAKRREGQKIPVQGTLGTRKRFKLPTLEEGFAAIYRVRPAPEGGFLVELEAAA